MNQTGSENTGKAKAVVLLSGGLDSCVTATLAKRQGYEIHCLTFDYGQRHSKEIEHAKQIAQYLHVKDHKILNIDFLKELCRKSNALTDETMELPKGRLPETTAQQIPSTYVPARNIILLSIAASYAESIGSKKIFYGANIIDSSGYPDCRPEFFKALIEAIRLGTKCGVEGKPIMIEAPLILLSKKQIVQLGVDLGAPIHLTWSCYRGGAKPCRVCDACILRKKGFEEAGIKDPAVV